MDCFNQAILLDEKNPPAYSGLGNAYLGKGDTDKAIDYFNKALSLDEKRP
jgi:tetratricopeptide (TPR) repeat protein